MLYSLNFLNIYFVAKNMYNNLAFLDMWENNSKIIGLSTIILKYFLNFEII